jgi:hypothetical protein
MKKLNLKTPWGHIQQQIDITPGITKITTASHGGFYLSPELNAQIPYTLKQITFGGLGETGWYEQDEDWTIVVRQFPQFFSVDEKVAADKLWLQLHPPGSS